MDIYFFACIIMARVWGVHELRIIKLIRLACECVCHEYNNNCRSPIKVPTGQLSTIIILLPCGEGKYQLFALIEVSC